MSALEEYPQWIDDDEDGVWFESAPQPIHPLDTAETHIVVNTYLRRVAALRRQKARALAVLANEKARIAKYEADVIGSLDRAIAHNEAPVLDWMRALHAADPKIKTRKLPWGEVKAHKAPRPKIEVDDEVAIPWLVEHRPDLLRHEASKELLHRIVKLHDGVAIDDKSGEVIPGIAVTPAEVNYSTKTDVDL
jgi:hypothetical protein